MKTVIRSITVCLVSLLILSALCTAVSAEQFTIGGTAPTVFIRNMNDYLVFCSEVEAGRTFEGELVMLSTKLDLTADCRPIGDDAHRFEGTFDGRGYTVTYYFDGDGENVGFFSVIGEKGTVRNLWVEGSASGSKCVGGVAGVNCGTVENCYSYVQVTGTEDMPGSVGVIVGENNGVVKDSFARAFSSDGAMIGTENGTTENTFNKDTEVSVSLAALTAASNEHEEYISWFWGWSNFPMPTREHGEHTFVKVDAIPASCEYSGQTSCSMCSVCGQTGGGYRVIRATGSHKPVHVAEVLPTCTDDGCGEGEICEVCGKVLSGFEPIAARHGELVIVPEVPPTATENGVSKGLVCSVCGEKIEGFEPIAATGETAHEDDGEGTGMIEDGDGESGQNTVPDDTHDTDGSDGEKKFNLRAYVTEKLNNIRITQKQYIIGLIVFGALMLGIVIFASLKNRKKENND